MKVTTILILHAAFTLCACSGSSSSNSNSNSISSNPPTVASSGASGGGTSNVPDAHVIDNEDMTAGLKGVDADKNGVRDDIDRLIAKKYSATSELKKAAEQKARALQKSMEATTRAQSLIAGDEITRAAACAYKTLPHASEQDAKFRERLSKDIAALTANTKERFKAYWNSERLGGGAVYKQAQEPVCD
jgi:hypothetical protein